MYYIFTDDLSKLVLAHSKIFHEFLLPKDRRQMKLILQMIEQVGFGAFDDFSVIFVIKSSHTNEVAGERSLFICIIKGDE